MINEFLDIYEAGLRDARAGLTTTEAIHRIVEKTNLLIRHFNLVQDNTNESIKDFSDKIEYYLNNGMIDEVSNKLDEFVKDGTLDKIINDNVFKKIKSQIDEIKSENGFSLTSTLTAGATSLTFTNSKITTNSTVDIYSSEYGVNPKTVTLSNGSIAMTFKAQSSDVLVKVVCK